LSFLATFSFFNFADLLWAKAVLLTSPLIATLTLTLTIPLAMLVDVVFHSKAFAPVYFIGSATVFAGFVLVNRTHSKKMSADDEQTALDR
jgi:solute carrier family 35 protein F5